MGSLQTRPAKLDDAACLLELRQRAILELASRDLPAEQIFGWAARVTIADMVRRIGEMDIRVAEADGAIVGWVAVDGNYLEGLYTDPRFERHWMNGSRRRYGLGMQPLGPSCKGCTACP